MERLLDKAISEFTNGSNCLEIKNLIDYIKYKIDLYPSVIALLILNLQTKGSKTCIHCLNVFDQAMEELGHPFITLIDKNTVLNELVKVIHPEFFGHRYEPNVRSKVITLLDKWAGAYKTYYKIVKCNEMIMKSEPIIKLNGSLLKGETIDDRPCIGDEFSNFRLSRLVRMPTPENIEAANKIIRAMVKNEEEQLQKRMEYLEGLGTVEEHCNIINDIITKNEMHTPEDINLLKELGSHCENQVQKLQAECNQAVDRNDPMLEQIIQTTIHASTTLNECHNFLKSPLNTPPQKKENIKSAQLINFDDIPSQPTPSFIDFNQMSNATSTVFNGIDMMTSDFLQKPPNVIQTPQDQNSLPKKTLADEFLDDLFK